MHPHRLMGPFHLLAGEKDMASNKHRRPGKAQTPETGMKVFSGKCASNYPGGYPVGYLLWLQKNGWWGDDRIHLCSGGVQDEDSVRVDIQRTCIPGDSTGVRQGQKSFQTTATHIADGRDTKIEGESFDCVLIDPPYSQDLARRLYGTEDHYGGINSFIKEGYRLVRPGGFIITLSYEVPRIYADLDLVAVYGIYQVPPIRNICGMFCFRKPGKREAQGLEPWTGPRDDC